MLNILVLVSSILFAILLALFTLLLPVAIIFNVKAGRVYRERLAGQIEKLRLGKMLALLGIDIDVYTSNERGVDIREHMTRCEQCGNHEECDEKLAQGNIAADEIGFCNNEQSLQELTRSRK